MRSSRTFIALVTAAGIALGGSSAAAQSPSYNDALLTRVRAAARAIPGDLPREIRYLKFAETRLKLGALLQDGGDQLVVAAFPVFQVRYSRTWIMIDAGMNRDVDTTLTFWPDRFARVQRGLRGAALILVTHEHHDHVAEALRSVTPEIVAPKTLLTRAQVQTLVERPDPPLAKLAPGRSADYLVFDYDVLYPVAPGVVLIKAPGHTPGSQMVYVRLASGREALFIGDITWMMAGVERRLQKPEEVSREVNEDRAALQQQIDWLSGLTARQGIVIITCHDDAWLQSLARRGLLRNDLDLAPQH